jgi:Tfp pilus assembly protein PilF
MRRANAYLKKEQLYNAKSDLEKALEISPKDETVLKELSKIKQILNI